METIDDIVADIRAQNQGLPEDGYALSPYVHDLLRLADRIKKAHEFELAVEKAKAAGEGYSAGKQSVTDCNRLEAAVVRENRTSQESRQVGNAAKMREALIKILGIADHLQTRYVLTNLMTKEILELKQIANAALSAPPRNCDRFKTREEAALAYVNECDAYIPQPMLLQIAKWLDWLFAEAKGN
jgi:hypothetical protein